MALTDGQTAWLDSQLGPGTWDPTDLEARLDRTGKLEFAAREILGNRLSGFRSQAAQVSVPGEIAVNFSATIRAIERQLEELPAAPPPDGGDGPLTGGAYARIVRPDTRAWRR